MTSRLTLASAVAWLIFIPDIACAADGLDGAKLSLLWALPFAGLLVCIATGPMLAAHVWERHYGKFAAGFALMVIAALYTFADPATATSALAHTLLHDYLPFVLLLLALYTVAGGIHLEGNLHDSVFTNTALLGTGALLASVVGTTGASLILIRPLIRANDDRRSNAHVIVFFIFLVSNIGGALTPLGDPPLFLGFLQGVDFFWTTTHLFGPMVFAGGLVLAIFMVIDVSLHRRERNHRATADATPDSPLRLHGRINLLLLTVIIGGILVSAIWKPGVSFGVTGITLELQNLLRDALFVLVTFVSMRLTKAAHRQANGFSWGPIREVAVLFAGIFICIVPVVAMLQAGTHGPLAALVGLVTRADGTANNIAYFWLTGGLSSFLDNAPTYLVFFQVAGGDAKALMTTGAATLAAISAGAVFMGANSYIGNAPNFMVYAIARDAGVRMPHFFGYMAWSAGVLLPVFLLTGWVFFR